MARNLYLKIWMPFFLAVFGSIAITSIEWLKQVLWPGISPWESHGITILIMTAIILIAAGMIYRFAQLHSEAQSLMASIVQSSDVGIIGQDLSGTILSWNKGAEKLLGYSADETKGKSIAITTPLDLRSELTEITEKIRRGEQIETYETMRLTKNGERVDVSVTVSPIRGDSGQIIGASSIIRDITDRKFAREELKKSNMQLRDLYRRLQSAREEERTRIAREIHDEFGQTLTALKFDLAWMKKQLPAGVQSAVTEKIDSMSKTIGAAISSIKTLSANLRPGILDDFGLIAAIEWQAEEFEARTGAKCKLKLDVGDVTIPEEISTVVFRIFQEALTNIMRHAGATIVELQLTEENGTLVFTIRDNGRGMDQDQMSPRSFGLLGIRERAAALSGTVLITSSHDQGTTVSARIPLHLMEILHD